MLYPSKLKIYGNKLTCSFRDLSTQSNSKASGETCCLCKDRYSKGLMISKQQLPDTIFGHSSHVSNLSFNGLSHQQSSSKTSGEVENVRRLKQKNEALRTGSITSNNRQQHPLFTGQQLFTNSPLRQPPSSDVLCSLGIPIQHLPPGANTSAPAIYAKPSTKTSLATAVPGAPYSSSSHRPFHHSMPVTTGQPASSSAGMGRSCSQEVRDMEDTNVNELASYLEDLLHIPRKMSTMAEMMYA